MMCVAVTEWQNSALYEDPCFSDKVGVLEKCSIWQKQTLPTPFNACACLSKVFSAPIFKISLVGHARCQTQLVWRISQLGQQMTNGSTNWLETEEGEKWMCSATYEREAEDRAAEVSKRAEQR